MSDESWSLLLAFAQITLSVRMILGTIKVDRFEKKRHQWAMAKINDDSKRLMYGSDYHAYLAGIQKWHSDVHGQPFKKLAFAMFGISLDRTLPEEYRDEFLDWMRESQCSKDSKDC